MTGLKSGRFGHWAGQPKRQFLRLSLFQQFATAATLSFAFTMTILGWWISERISQGILRRSAEAGAMFLQSTLEPHIQSLAEGAPLSPAEIAELEEISSSYALRRHVLSIKIWQPNGTVAFASERSLIGRTFPTDEIRPALKGEVQGYLNVLDEDENAFERTLAVPLYEIYAPLYRRGTREIIAVGEFYENAEKLNDELISAVRENWMIVGSSTFMLLALLFAIVFRGSKTIDRQKADLESKYLQQIRLHELNEELRTEMQNALRQTARIDHMIQRRLGAELHDGPAQLLTFVMLRFDEICEELHDGQADRSSARQAGDQIRIAVADALADLRAIASGLFLPLLKDGNDAAQAVLDVVRAHERRTGGRVELCLGEVPPSTDADLVQCVARVTQEALTNAEKHAGDPSPKVELLWSGGILRLSVQDKGPGLNPAQERATHASERLGLAGMRYRLESLGGSFELRSSPGCGTTVYCEVPLPSPLDVSPAAGASHAGEDSGHHL